MRRPPGRSGIAARADVKEIHPLACHQLCLKNRCSYAEDTSMQYRELHPWHVRATEAQRIQQRLRRHIQVGTSVRDIRYIAGADVAVAPTTPTLYAGVVVLDYTTL